MLEAQNIHKSYNSLKVLKGIDIRINAKEIVAIVGASGAGKSTLLHILGTLDQVDEGTLMINDVNIKSLSSNDLAHFRNKNLGFIFQSHNLFPEFTAIENICMPAWLGKSKEKPEARAKELLEMLNLAHRMHHKPSEMSGGEQQRVSVARALINNPLVVFADEPSGNLDSANADELHQLFFRLRDEMSKTFVIVTHNDKLANMADRKFVMKDGTILNQ